MRVGKKDMATLHELVESNGWRKVIYYKISSENQFEGIVRDSDIDWLFFESRSGLMLIESKPVPLSEQPSFFPERPEIFFEKELIDERI